MRLQQTQAALPDPLPWLPKGRERRCYSLSARANKEVDPIAQVPGCCSGSVPVLKWVMEDHAAVCEGWQSPQSVEAKLQATRPGLCRQCLQRRQRGLREAIDFLDFNLKETLPRPRKGHSLLQEYLTGKWLEGSLGLNYWEIIPEKGQRHRDSLAPCAERVTSAVQINPKDSIAPQTMFY